MKNLCGEQGVDRFQGVLHLDRGGALPAGELGASSAVTQETQPALRTAASLRRAEKPGGPLRPLYICPNSLRCRRGLGGDAARRQWSALVARLSRRGSPLDADYGRTDKARCNARP